jgi:DNA primase
MGIGHQANLNHGKDKEIPGGIAGTDSNADPGRPGHRPQRSGRVWKGLCPFRDESTPSFYAYDHSIHCFGCGAHGDAIDFVIRTRAITLDPAIAGLAAAANLGLPYD